MARRLIPYPFPGINPWEEGGYTSSWLPDWSTRSIRTAYIPVKEMLANAPGFRSLYSLRDIHFEEIYFDILNLAYLPELRQQPNVASENLLSVLTEVMGGDVVIKGGRILLGFEICGFTGVSSVGRRDTETRVALVVDQERNAAEMDRSCFGDEPETNLNPQLFGTVIDALLTLQRHGLQVFLATHDYVILKELDLQMTPDDEVAFHSLYRDAETHEIKCHTAGRFEHMREIAILDAFDSLYDRDVERAIAGINTSP